MLVMTAKKDRYGYELVHSISEKFQIAEGTVYPLLRRLTQEGLFTTYLQESQEGPPRKYYKLTKHGWMMMTELVVEWRHFTQGVDEIIREALGDDES